MRVGFSGFFVVFSPSDRWDRTFRPWQRLEAQQAIF